MPCARWSPWVSSHVRMSPRASSSKGYAEEPKARRLLSRRLTVLETTSSSPCLHLAIHVDMVVGRANRSLIGKIRSRGCGVTRKERGEAQESLRHDRGLPLRPLLHLWGNTENSSFGVSRFTAFLHHAGMHDLRRFLDVLRDVEQGLILPVVGPERTGRLTEVVARARMRDAVNCLSTGSVLA